MFLVHGLADYFIRATAGHDGFRPHFQHSFMPLSARAGGTIMVPRPKVGIDPMETTMPWLSVPQRCQTRTQMAAVVGDEQTENL